MGVHHGYTFIKKNDKHRISITLHELLHGNGFAWPCTVGQSRGHVRGKSIISNQNHSASVLGKMIYNHNNTGCPDLKDSVYLTPTSADPFDPLQLVCFLAEKSGRGVPNKTFKWPKKYDHKNFLKIKKGRNWCTYGLSEYAQPEWFKKWK